MNKTLWSVVVMIVIVGVAMALPALCQPGGQTGGGQGGPGGPPGMHGMGGPMGGPPAPTLVVAAQGVYVMMGPHIYRLDPLTLKVLASGELPRPEPPADAPKPPTTDK
jgi:hypothetical protein